MGFSWNRCHTTLTTACRPRSPQPHSAPQDAESLLLPTGKGPLNWGGAMGISPTSNPQTGQTGPSTAAGTATASDNEGQDNARRAAVLDAGSCPSGAWAAAPSWGVLRVPGVQLGP